MSVYVIADLHLSGSVGKSMDIFGKRWAGYTERIVSNWTRLVGEDDTVIIPGDISWAMNMSEALSDLKLIDSLPGKKIFLKGNHDLWWSTLSKMSKELSKNNITSLSFLQNNAYLCDNFVICGSRGWFLEEKNQKTTVGIPDYDKIVAREVIRLKMSLEAGKKLLADHPDYELLVFLHFPPAFSGFVCREIIDVLHQYDVRRCFFGHIHDPYVKEGHYFFEDIEMRLISADYLGFIPFKI